MKKNKTNITFFLSAAILIAGAYYIYGMLKKTSKDISEMDSSDIAEFIVQSGKHSNKESLSAFDPAFLIAWAHAIQEGKNSFIYNEKAYNTQGGKSLK